MLDNFFKDFNNTKLTLTIGVLYFLSHCFFLIVSVLAGDNIYETRYSFTDHSGEREYSIVGDLRIAFVVLIISVLYYLYMKSKEKK